MAITCTLSRENILALAGVIYKEMSSTPKGQTFSVEGLMNELYKGISNAQGRDVALQYMQQAPYTIRLIEAKLEDIEISMSLENLKQLSISFRNIDSGIQAVDDFFSKGELNSEDLSTKSNSITNTPEGTDTDVEEEERPKVVGDKRLRARNPFSTTFEEFLTLDPNTKTEDTVEIVDKEKLRIYNTIAQIYKLTSDFDTLGNPVYQGVEIMLTTMPLTKLTAEQRTSGINALLGRMGGIKSAGTGLSNVTPANQIFALIVSDKNGTPILFDDRGNITTKDKGGKIVYQMLRDVRLENGRYRVTDIYGIEDKILGAAEEANARRAELGYKSNKEFAEATGKSFNEFVKEVDAEQQEQFKALYDFRQELIKGSTAKLSIVGASQGVSNQRVKSNIKLSQVSGFYPELAERIIADIQTLDTNYRGFESGETITEINGEVFQVDRADITEDLATKIADVLTSDLPAQTKYDFYSQFYAKEIVDIPNKTRRHMLYFDNGKLLFEYYEFTKQEVETKDIKNNPPLKISLDQPTANKDIYNILMTGKSSKAGRRFAAKFDYIQDLLTKGTYSDYVNGEFVEKNYRELLLTTNAEIMLSAKGGLPLFNSYIKFALPTEFSKEVEAAKEQTKRDERDDRSEVRKFKDRMVDVVKNSPAGSITAEVVKITQSNEDEEIAALKAGEKIRSLYSIDVKIAGQEGVHKVYGVINKPAIGERLYLEVKDVVDNGYLFKDTVKLLNEVDGRIYDMGSLAETDYNAKELRRQPIVVQTDTAAAEEEVEILSQFNPFDTTVPQAQAPIEDIIHTNPSDTAQPSDDTDLMDTIKRFKLDRNTKLPKGVTPQMVERATEWMKNHPIMEHIDVKQVMNLVNSNVYAQFVLAGSTLLSDMNIELKDGAIAAVLINKATGGSMVDAYHEAWHVFSQLYLTKEQKSDLYKEVRKLKPEYANLSFLEIEEMLAEDFRSYALNPKATKGSPVRNTLFRRILNFLKKLFGVKMTSASDLIRGEELATEGVAGEMFYNLYFAKSNPKLLNNYTPLISNVQFDILNRGIIREDNKNEDALNEFDAAVVVESLDSIASELIDETNKYYMQGGNDNKAAAISILTDPENMKEFLGYAKRKFEKDLKDTKEKITVKPKVSFNTYETLSDLEKSAVAIIRTSKGDDKYFYLRSQVDDFDKLNLNTERGERIKGEIYQGVIDVIGDYFDHKTIKANDKQAATVIVVNSLEEAKAQYDAYLKDKESTVTAIEQFPDNAIEDQELSYEDSLLLDNLRILRATLDNWDNAVKYYTNKSAFEIVTKKVKLSETDPEAEAIVDPTNSEKYSKALGEMTLQQLADKEVIYLLKSLFAVTREGDKITYQYNKLGYKKLASFKKVWNAIVRATNSIKDPLEMYQRILDVVDTYPELKQLVENKLPNPNAKVQSSVAFDITTSFWSVFSLPKVSYIQLNAFEDTPGEFNMEVSNASTDISNTVRKFTNKFAAKLEGPFITRDENNITNLNLQAVVEGFSDKSGNLKAEKEFDFLASIGFAFDDIAAIKAELNSPSNRREYGVEFIFKTVKDLADAEKAGALTLPARKVLNDFKKSPIDVLRKGIEPNIIGVRNSNLLRKGSTQSTQVDRIITLQNKLGSSTSNFSVQNPEKNRVNEHINDNTLTVIADGINTSAKKTEMYKFGKVTRHLDPLMNPFAESSVTLKTLFDSDTKKRPGYSISVEQIGGTQVFKRDFNLADEIINESIFGSNTTSLDQRGKMLQEFHTFLKSGRVELMRPGSKNSSFSWRVDGGFISMGKKKDPHLYLDIDTFLPNTISENDAITSIFLPYLASEVKRINIYKTNPEAKNYIGYNTKSVDGKAAGELFNYFDGILNSKTKELILSKVTDPSISLLDYLKTDTALQDVIRAEIKGYFTNKTNELYRYFQKGKFIDGKLMNRLNIEGLSTEQKEKILLRAFMYNYWIHNMETSILFIGDIAQYKHSKQELHKRISGLISNGPRLRTDEAAQRFINDVFNHENTYAYSLGAEYNKFSYKGYVNTAIMQEITRDSVYLDPIRKGLTADYERRYKFRNIPNKEQLIKDRVEKEVAKYTKREIKEADGQGYITFDAYRTLKKLQKKWSQDQENLYQKIINKESVSVTDIIEMFPVYKLQNFGFAEASSGNTVQNTVLPVTIMHKFALLPLIPSMIKGTELENLHHQMLKNNIQYATFDSGSKVGAITSDGNSDNIFADKDQKELKKDIKFTPNIINAAFIKEAASVNSKYKGETIFSTQLRKLILNGLYENGKLINEANAPIVNKYENSVKFYTELLKYELLDQIEYKKDGKTLIGKPDKFLELIQQNLERKDYPSHLIRSLQTNKDGTLRHDLSYTIDPASIEKTILSIVEKKFVRQYVKGEPLVQVSSALTNGLITGGRKFEKPTEEERRKYLGSNTLPFYNIGEDGKTRPMKVAIALQGDFNNLLNLKHTDGKPIKTIERLNEMIKDDQWLDTEDNRKAITLVAVRIPVQGLNSMEMIEVYEFLDPAAGNLIILPTEIVAKSGGDYDVDKLTTFFPNIDTNGNYVKSNIDNADFFKKADSAKNKKQLIKLQKQTAQNNFIEDIKSILELPENYANLVRPNDTYILQDLATELEDKVSSYDKYLKLNDEGYNRDKDGKIMISPTTTLEPLYNIGKHEANLIGKMVLGIAASENALSPLFDAAGGKMPKTYKSTKYKDGRYIIPKDASDYNMRLLLNHNEVDGQISLSSINSVDGIDKIVDVFSQGMNGWLDIEKDEWIFYIQGNLEVAPTFLYLIKAGVPVRDAVMFVSQPMIREYAEQQRLVGSSYGELLGVAPEQAQFKQYQAAKNIADKYTPRYMKAIMDQIRPDQEFTVQYRYYDKVQRKQLSGVVGTNMNKRALALAIQRGDIRMEQVSRIFAPRGNRTIEYYIRPDVTNSGNYDAAVFASSKANLTDGRFNEKEMVSIINSKGTIEELSNNEVISEMAMFLHFTEIQKQIKGISALKRKAKPEKTFRNFQEIYLRDVDIDELDNNSQVDQEFKERLFKESIVSSLFDKDIIMDIAAPMLDLRNNNINNEAIKRFIRERSSDIIANFGEGTDGVIRFVEKYKNAISNFIVQNYLTNFIDANGSIVNVPEKFRSMDVKLSKDLNLDAKIDGKTITINLDNIRNDYREKAYLTDSDKAYAYSKRDGLKAFNPLEDPFPTESSYIKYVLERTYLQEKGFKGLELNQIALINNFNTKAIMENSEYSYTKQVLDLIESLPERVKIDYPILDQIASYMSTRRVGSNLVTNYVLTLNDRDVLDGVTKDQYAANIRALGNPRMEKVRDADLNLKISRLFNYLPLMTIYQHGIGTTPFGFDQTLPQNMIQSAMVNASNLFKINYWNKDTLDLVFNKLTANNLLFKNYVATSAEFNNPELAKTETIELVNPEETDLIRPKDNERPSDEKPTEDNDTLFGLDTSSQENLEFHINTINVVSNFLDAVGVEQRLVPQFLQADGTVVESALAAANFINGTVDVIEDVEKRPGAWNKLPEEAAHFWYRLLKTDSPLKQALWNAHEVALKNDKLYKTKYGEQVSSPEDLTEESIGQLIAEAIKRIETKNGAPKDYSFFEKFIKWINRIIAKFKKLLDNQDPFEIAAIKILSSDTSDLMTWQEYNALNNIVYPDTAITADSIPAVDYSYFGNDFSVIEDEEGNLLYGAANSPYFNTIEELDKWIEENTDYVSRINEVRESEKFFDNLLNKKYKKKTKYLNKTLDRFYTISKITNTELPEAGGLSIAKQNMEINKALTPEEKKVLQETNNYQNITPTLRIIPEILRKYKKNPVVLSEKIKLDGAKKQELEIIQAIIDIIKAENPTKKTITGEELSNEIHTYLETNYLLGFANEKAHLDYLVQSTFSHSVPSTKHNKISIRFNDRYYSGGHFSKNPSAWGNLTYFDSNNTGKKDAVLVHEIQNDNIEKIRAKVSGTNDIDTNLEGYLKTLTRLKEEKEENIKNNNTKLYYGFDSASSRMGSVAEYIIDNRLSDNETSYNQFKSRYRELVNISSSEQMMNSRISEANKRIDRLYTDKRILQSFSKNNTLEEILGAEMIAEIDEALTTSTSQSEFRNKVEVINAEIKINKFIQEKYGKDTRRFSLTPAYKARTNRTRLNTSIKYLLINSVNKSIELIYKQIEGDKRNIVLDYRQIKTLKYNTELSKITRNQFTTLVDNINYNRDLLENSAKKRGQSKVDEENQNAQNNREELLQDLMSEYENRVSEANEITEKNREVYNQNIAKTKKILDTEMGYFTPLVNYMIQKHIREFGKDVPMYFSGYEITKRTQGNNRTALIYAGKDEVVYTKEESDLIKYRTALALGLIIEPLMAPLDSISTDFEAYQPTEDEIRDATKRLSEYKRASESNLNYAIQKQMELSNSKPIETGALYNMMTQVPGIKLIWQNSIPGIVGNPGGYVIDLSNYNLEHPVLYGLDQKATTEKQEEVYPILQMLPSNVEKILNGTKVITNRATEIAPGKYKLPNGSIVNLKYLGQANVTGNTVNIRNSDTGLNVTRTLDAFAKAEGFKNATDFKQNNKFSKNFINGSQPRFIYQIGPATAEDITVQTLGEISAEANPEIDEFKTYLEENNNEMPKEFNSSQGRKYILNENNLYDLVDDQNKMVYLRNMDLKTGKVVNVPTITTKVSEQSKKTTLSEIKEMINTINLDMLMAEDGYDIYSIMNDIENVTTQEELTRIENKIREYICR